MDVRVLGQIEIRGDGSDPSETSAAGSGAVSIGGPRQRRLLAALVVRSGEVVPLDQLIDIVRSGANAARHARSSRSPDGSGGP